MKVQSGIRLDKLTLERFRELCARERLRVGEAVEELMRICLQADSIASFLRVRPPGG